MPRIKSFKAVYYNEDKVGDLSKVVSPPYDIISEDEQTYLQNLSPYNFTHIDFGRDKSGDDRTENKYKRAAKIFADWLSKNVMIQDTENCIYFYKQEYTIQGQKHTRMGFISLMELQDEKESKVYPHENTHANAVDDRYKLTAALNSNLSCIFVCYSDRNRKVEKIFNKKICASKPLIDVADKDGIHHKLWRLRELPLIKEISDSVADQQLFIADGHHRYKVALEYRKAKMAKKPDAKGSEPFNYAMTYFTNLESKDLKIFPMHRIIKKLDGSLDFISELFRVDKLNNKNDLNIMLAKAGHNEHAFGLYRRGSIQLLRLKNKLMIEDRIKEGSKDYKSLDATILKNFILDRLGIKSDDIKYTSDANVVFEQVDTYQADGGFIMNPVKIAQLKAIALNGERMPPKTTYFYPKVLSGLTVYKMD